ncbi:MAG: sugar phosphate isomerase/epimerase [Oscillospiraceae bacterium]|jgi:sugar phosphate isomerase/epimerase|nr:sugar phosphate isomerase/epimerase [Oscillospiraceae bacterium]
MKFAVQLYSLRELVQSPEDLPALFPRIKALGFDGVEFAGYQGLAAEALRAALDAAGLVAMGTHMGLNDLRPENLPATIRFCKTLGMRHIGIGGAPHGTPEDTAASCAVLKSAYEAGLEQGVVIYYHNHVGEFEPFADGTLAIDSFLAACPLELDTCWSFCGGVDNYKFLTEHKDRICLVHIKDAAEGHKSAALGEGIVDLAAVVKAAKELDLEWLVLEDETQGTGIESVAKGAKWLQENAK